MVTVKYNEDEEGNKRIILKGGKVSCSCCPEPQECCMYPAQGIVDEIYTYEDLPDEIIGPKITPSGGQFSDLIVPNGRCPTTVFTKNRGDLPVGVEASPIAEKFYGGEHFYTADSWIYQDPPFGEVTIYPFVGIFGPIEENEPENQYIWRFAYYGIRNDQSGQFGPYLISVQTQWPCLIRVFEQTPDFYGCFGKDQFADTYTLTYSKFSSGPTLGSESTVVTRDSLCVWSGLDNCGRRVFLIIAPFDYDVPGEEQYTWAFFYYFSTDCSGSGALTAYKNGPQNTPIGEYRSFVSFTGGVS